jgi:hypothetical protein
MVWRLFATQLERADTTEADRPKLGAPSLYSVRNSLSQPVDNAGDAVPDRSHVEIDEQAEAFVGQPEIGQKLLLVDWGYQLNGFDCNDDLVFDHQIGPESGVDAEILIDHRDRLLL